MSEESANEEEYHLVTRDDWGAKPPKRESPRLSQASYVYCLNTFSRECKTEEKCSELLREMQANHTTNPFYLNDIRFNFLINDDGTIYEGRGWGIEPTLPAIYRPFNDRSVLIGYFGYFSDKNLTTAMEKSRDFLIEYGLENKYIEEKYELRQILTQPR